MSVFAVPGWVRAVSGASRGSFAPCGRDAGLKTGAPLPARDYAGLEAPFGRSVGVPCCGVFVEVVQC